MYHFSPRIPKKVHKRLAVVVPNSSNFLLEVVTGLQDELDNYPEFSYELNLIQGNNDLSDLQTRVDTHLTYKAYDLIFSFGKTSTQIVKDVTIQKRLYTPIVFGGVADPVGAGLVHSISFSGNHLTGVYSLARNYERQMKIFLSLNFSLKRVLFLYNPLTIDNMNEEIKKAKKLLHQEQIHVEELLVKNLYDIKTTLPQRLKNVDFIVIFRDYTTLSCIDEIVAIGNAFNLPIYSSDFESVKAGAVVGISDFERQIGIETAKKSLEILSIHKNSHRLSLIEQPWTDRIMVNRKAHLSKELQRVINTRLSSEVIFI